jgi:hypothetical protein
MYKAFPLLIYVLRVLSWRSFPYQYLKKSIDLSKCSREISDIVPLSSDVEQRPMFISVPVPGINNNTAMIINIKTLWCCTMRDFCLCFLMYGDVLCKINKIIQQKLLALPDHLSSPPVFSRVCVTRSLFVCLILCRSLFVLFHLAIVFSVLRFRDSVYPFGIFKSWTPRITNKGLGAIGAKIGPTSVLHLKASPSLS